MTKKTYLFSLSCEVSIIEKKKKMQINKSISFLEP